jgi:hypothetical protein
VGTAGQREGEQAHVRELAPTGLAHGTKRERGREAHSGWRRQAGPACQAKGARGGAGLSGLSWAELAFPFPGISNCFSIYFL